MSNMILKFISVQFAVILPTLRMLASDGALSEEDRLGSQEVTKWSWGASSNGVAGGVSITYSGVTGLRARVSVFVHEAYSTNPLATTASWDWEAANTNALISPYFGETDVREPHGAKNMPIFVTWINYFCGPMVLKAANGEEVPPAHMPLCSSSSYPTSFSRFGIAQAASRGGQGYGSAPVPSPLLTRMPRLCSFNLDDEFQLAKPGHYELTVWPMIYKRSATNDDLWLRIDVPCVTISVDWNGAVR